jgi:ElaB/YqjD/DUF883 family membrane-anchored ribosome-binding protein
MQPTVSETSKKINGAFKDGASEFKGAADSALSSLEKVSHDFGRQAGEMASRVSEKSQDYYKASEDYVKSNPVKGVAIAAGAGLVVGSLLTMVLNSRKQ